MSEYSIVWKYVISSPGFGGTFAFWDTYHDATYSFNQNHSAL